MVGGLISGGTPGPLTGQRLGAYTVSTLLGVGGMGEVYRAYDPRLAREVAIKVLPQEFSRDPARQARLQREARAAAQLGHPNIVTIYDIGVDGDGLTYLVYELVDGRTLRHVLADGALPVETAIRFAQDVASGLAAAHKRGIVHRDVKPENLLVTAEGRVKILDFGIASIADAAMKLAPAINGAFDTAPGIVLGTVGYMSPEQMRGLPIDERADIFSCGAVLYEMVAGTRPFTGSMPLEVAGAVLTFDPPPLPTDAVLSDVIAQCLQKDREVRIASATDLLKLLTHVARRVDPRRPEPTAPDAAMLTRVAILPVQSSDTSRVESPRTIALNEAIASSIRNIQRVLLIDNASIAEGQRSGVSDRGLAALLEADLLVRTKIQEHTSAVALQVELLDRNGTVQWLDQASAHESEFVVAQQQLAGMVSHQLLERLDLDLRTPQPALAPVSHLANEYYARGLYHWRKLSFAAAAKWFQRSVETDQTFAPAFAGLAHAKYSMAGFRGQLTLTEYLEIRRATERALEIDPHLAGAHLINARRQWTPEWDHAGAEDSFRRALDRNRYASDVNFYYANYLAAHERIDEALQRAAASAEYDPISAVGQVRLGVTLVIARRYRDAIDVLSAALDFEPDMATAIHYLGCAHVAAGEAEVGVSLLERLADGSNPEVLSQLAWAYTRCDRHAEARGILEALLERRRTEPIPSMCFAWCYANLGRIDDALDALNRALEERCIELVGLKVDPLFDGIRGDRRFQAIVTRVMGR